MNQLFVKWHKKNIISITILLKLCWKLSYRRILLNSQCKYYYCKIVIIYSYSTTILPIFDVNYRTLVGEQQLGQSTGVPLLPHSGAFTHDWRWAVSMPTSLPGGSVRLKRAVGLRPGTTKPHTPDGSPCPGPSAEAMAVVRLSSMTSNNIRVVGGINADVLARRFSEIEAIGGDVAWNNQATYSRRLSVSVSLHRGQGCGAPIIDGIQQYPRR